MLRRFNRVWAVIFFILIFFPAFLSAFDELYNAPGFNPYRETFSSMANEHIDTFTGGLILTFEDLRLPGNGGLDLVIQRTFNSKNTCNEYTGWLDKWYCSRGDENAWLGFGWTLHFGRLFVSNIANKPHVVEMPDGSRHPAYNRIGASQYITKDYWLLDASSSPQVLTLTNGTKIYFGQAGPSSPDFPAGASFACYTTKIQDVHGNEINIYYKSFGSNEIAYVIDSVGRRIDFTTATVNYASRLVSISGPGVSVTYTHTPHSVTYMKAFLTEVRPPVGNPWRYQYDEATYDLVQAITPSGGVMSYRYDVSSIYWGGRLTFYIWAVIEKTAGGAAPAGFWSIRYAQGIQKDYTEIVDPCGRIHRHRYHGYGEELPLGSLWKVGLPKSKEIVGEETVVYGWTNSAPISYDDYVVLYLGRDYETYVPLLTQRSITRDGKAYVNNYSNYDAYANPQTISESGDKTRNRSLTYWYDTSKNIVQNKPASETVSGGFPGAFSTNYSYDTNTGNLLQMNRYGVVTSYTYYANGNLRTKTDANGNTISYDWSKGKVSKITNPIYSITRIINSNGTIASETNGRGFTTAYTYDGNLRLTKIAPPVGNPTTFSYPTDNSYKQETRGGFSITHYNDGFGRLTGSSDSKGISTTIAYKACGPKNYSTSNIGDTVYYDNFGRATQITHKDNSKITYAYSLSNVTITDEASNATDLTYHAFGNPDEKLLVGIRDAMNNTTAYHYNILGGLLSVTQGTLMRTFSYDAKNFLISETHPEKGTISYTRDPVGNLNTKTDALGTTAYTYDPLDRLKTINYGSGSISFTYDHVDNRTAMNNPHATLTYAYDGSNRLTHKGSTLLGRVYNTYYGYDGNDNLTRIDYPSGNRITYAYNNNNQLTSMTGPGWAVSSMTYYTTGTPIGLPQSFTYSNALTTQLTYTARNLTKDIDVSGSVLDLAYGYDTRGNMTSMTNNLAPLKNQAFDYDKLNRLTAFNGPWGTGSFTYDARGNRLTKVIAEVATNYTYTNNRLTSSTGGEPFSFNYNANGDVTQMNEAGGKYRLHYDRLHNLISFNYNYFGYYGGAALAQFTYDGDGMRVTKTSNGSKIASPYTIVYHYDKSGRVISETDSSGNLLRDYIYANGKLVVRMEPAAGYFYHTDPAGTPLAMTDTSGAVVWKADYKPFGEEHQITGKNNDLRFVGKEKDKETGLLYFGARYMEAMIGRFLSTDPIGPVDPKTGKVNTKNLLNPQRLNYYAYGLNNPYKYIDLDGRWPERIHNRTIRDAFPDMPRNLQNAIERGSVNVDRDQSMESSYKHNMRAPGQTIEEARNQMNKFIEEKVKEYKTLMSQGKTEEAYFRLGEVIHPLMDSTSPSHEGFQVWRGLGGLKELGEGTIHGGKEQFISQERLNKPTNLIRDFYDKHK